MPSWKGVGSNLPFFYGDEVLKVYSGYQVKFQICPKIMPECVCNFSLVKSHVHTVTALMVLQGRKTATSEFTVPCIAILLRIPEVQGLYLGLHTGYYHSLFL